jgi:predicted nucleic acid-binding protein
VSHYEEIPAPESGELPVDAAKRMGCVPVYSEDLNSGQDYGGVRVANPFLPKV